jgi:ribosomal protein S18 acetylase RimI-like enzyme
MSAAIAEVAGEPAGFIAFTSRATAFHRSAIGTHRGSAARALAASILREPRALIGVVRTLRLVLSRGSGPERRTGDPCAEVLAFGVLPAFRDRQFVRATGVRISQRLLEHAIASFRAEEIPELQAVVDADNRETLVFYRMLGAQIEPFVQAGVPSRLVRLRIAPGSADRAAE